MKIVQLSDLHLTLPDAELFGSAPLARLELAIDRILADHADADFCLLTGDLADAGSDVAYASLAQALETLADAGASAARQPRQSRGIAPPFSATAHRRWRFHAGGARYAGRVLSAARHGGIRRPLGQLLRETAGNGWRANLWQRAS